MAVLDTRNVLKALDNRIRKVSAQPVVAVLVGFTANYAIWVHERMGIKHPVGEAKFLENAWIENFQTIQQLIMKGLMDGKSTLQSLMLGGLFLQREAQRRCPVDTGYLRASAFTRPEE